MAESIKSMRILKINKGSHQDQLDVSDADNK